MKKIFLTIWLCAWVMTVAYAEPKISIITSVYNGDEFIEEFLNDITKQTIFDQCELIMINANSPGSEEFVIKKYMKDYPNIMYKRLDSDPGIYGVWNSAIKMSRGKYITNANLDDRLAHNCYEVYAQELDRDLRIMLVYSDFYLTKNPHETFEKHTGSLVSVPKFSKKHMNKCLPGCSPMWRKIMHDKFGLFDESYKSSGDFEMWLRAVEGGAQFKKVPGCYALYYQNPHGISTSIDSSKLHEDQRTRECYSHVWTDDEYSTFYKLARRVEKVGSYEQRAWSLALSYYLKAFSMLPDRAEPLVRIAQHYYQEGDMALAYLFAQRACALPEPKNIDEGRVKLYRCIRYDILGIVAWYVGEFESGQVAIERALAYCPEDQRLLSNLKFYTERKTTS